MHMKREFKRSKGTREYKKTVIHCYNCLQILINADVFFISEGEAADWKEDFMTCNLKIFARTVCLESTVQSIHFLEHEEN